MGYIGPQDLNVIRDLFLKPKVQRIIIESSHLADQKQFAIPLKQALARRKRDRLEICFYGSDTQAVGIPIKFVMDIVGAGVQCATKLWVKCGHFDETEIEQVVKELENKYPMM